jgi:hypothetical protein
LGPVWPTKQDPISKTKTNKQQKMYGM